MNSPPVVLLCDSPLKSSPEYDRYQNHPSAWNRRVTTLTRRVKHTWTDVLGLEPEDVEDPHWTRTDASLLLSLFPTVEEAKRIADEIVYNKSLVPTSLSHSCLHGSHGCVTGP